MAGLDPATHAVRRRRAPEVLATLSENLPISSSCNDWRVKQMRSLSTLAWMAGSSSVAMQRPPPDGAPKVAARSEA
jgi:hypothetical protein